MRLWVRPDVKMRSSKLPQFFPWVFKGHEKRSEHRKTRDALPAIAPCLRIIRFQGIERVKQDRDPC